MRFLLFLVFLILFSHLRAQQFNWVSTFNGAGFVDVTEVKQDQSGNYYAIGKFDGTVDFNNDPIISNTLNSISRSWFILKLDSLGNFMWVKKFEITTNVFDYHILVDKNGEIYTSGYFRISADFDLNAGINVLTTTSSSDYDVFLAKYTSSGSIIWAQSLPATNNQRCYVMNRDSSGAFYLGGGDQASASIWKFSDSGAFLWKKDFNPVSPGILSNYVDDISFDSNNDVYLSGFFWTSIDADPNAGVANITGQTNRQNHFLIKLDSAGSHLWSGSLSSTLMNIKEILVAKNSDLYIIGDFGTYGTGAGSDFDPGPGVTNLIANSVVELFILKLDLMGNFQWVKHTNSGNSTVPVSAIFDQREDIVITGDIAMLTRFNFNPSDSLVISNGGVFDGFLVKVNKNADVKFLGRWSSCDPKFLYKGINNEILVAGQYNQNMDFDLSSAIVRAGFLNYEDGFVTNLSTCQPDSQKIKIWACNNYTVPSGKYTVNSDGVYYDTLNTYYGCDSILVLDVNIHDESEVTRIARIACDEYKSPGNIIPWTSSGTYFDTLASNGGCDSIVRLLLIIKHSDSSAISINGCGSTYSPSGSFVMNTSGYYSDTIVAANGCDSILTINFNLVKVNTSMGYTGTEMRAFANNASFQWIYCDNDSVLTGDTLSTYVPFANGGYKVAVYQYGCWDTSSCYNVYNASLDDLVSDIAKVYPNPFSSFITIDFTTGFGNGRMILSSVAGQVLYQEQLTMPSRHTIQVPLDQGVYILELVSEEGLSKKEVLVKQSGL